MKENDNSNPLSENANASKTEENKNLKDTSEAQESPILMDDSEEQKLNDSYDDTMGHEDHIDSDIQDIKKEIEQQSVAEEPVAEEKPETEEEPKAAEEPVAEEPVAEEPAAEEKPETEEKKKEEEKINYSLLSREDLVKVLREKLDHGPGSGLRSEVEGIRKVFQEKQDEFSQELKTRYLEEGGLEEDYKPLEEAVAVDMRELMERYRVIKADYSRQLEKDKQDNLVLKEEILVNMKALMEEQEGFESTFRKFKDLQRKWFAAGQVPQARLKDLWSSYNFHVDQFNDYVRINRELRALDLKKNLELKAQLCERTEELDAEANVVSAFKTLQKYHARWREIGPVPRSDRDEIWERFKAATSLINKKHQEYHSRMKESLHENLEKKARLCEQVEGIAAENYESHSDWSEKTSIILEIQKTWKTIGYAPKKDNNAIYARFRKSCDQFFSRKADFYSEAREEQQHNLVKKREIVEQAEVLCESQDWKATTSALIRLQKQWKESGPVSRRDSDRLWKRFRGACDRFFENKNAHFKNMDSSYEENLKSKEALLVEMDAYSAGENPQENLKALENFQRRYDEIGFVPSGQKEQIREQFQSLQDKLLENCGLSESERSVFRFRNRIKAMATSSRPEMKLGFERDKMINKLQQLRSDIAVWENNIGFFKSSDSSDPTIQGFHEKIEAAHNRIKLMELKIRIIDEAENAN